jgi:hypothetical protein
MGPKLSVERIVEISNIFIGVLFKIASFDKDEINDFFNLVLGLSYASKKLLKSIEKLGLIVEEQFNEIEQQLANAAKNDIESTIKMCENKIKEKKDVRE